MCSEIGANLFSVNPIIDETLFDEILREVKVNLTDTYQRFRKIPDVKKLISNEKVIENMLIEGENEPGILENIARKSVKLTKALIARNET